MTSEFRLPALGADMESGTIVQWNVAPGDKVRRGQVVAVVETDKGAIDVEIFEDGVVRELVVPTGTQVPVGTVIARLETDAPAAGPAARAKISPAARLRARELGVDVSTLRGTGPDGRSRSTTSTVRGRRPSRRRSPDLRKSPQQHRAPRQAGCARRLPLRCRVRSGRSRTTTCR
jgi:pyruvate dehydrogenase E2 component (dihydrolipoamide acetyltransferase)